MNEFLNWGILGASRFAAGSMAPAIHVAPGGCLAALATRSPERAGPFRDLDPRLTVQQSYEALLEDAGIDAVYIPLPNSLHVPWTLKALDAGKHVLCEKPIAMQAAEFDALIDARDRSGKLAAEAFMIVFHPQWQRVRELLTQGVIGQLIHVDGAFSFNNRDTGNIRNKPETGGGALRDIGVYVIGATRFVTGQEPTSVHSRIRWANGVDGFTQIAADFDGFTYNAIVSTRLHPRQHMTFHGDAGVIHVSMPFNAQVAGEPVIRIDGADQVSRFERFPAARQYELQVAAFNQAALHGTPYACPLEFSRGTQQVIDDLFASSEDLP